MPMSEAQETQQTWGPERPRVSKLVLLLETMPAHYEIQSVAINGQTGAVWIEFWHEGAQGIKKFD